MDVVVQPSVPWMSLNEQIKDSGLFFPVDPGPSVRVQSLTFRSSSSILEHMLTRETGPNRRHGWNEL
jgi:FAD/FMN-containing dehydrogenase